MPIPSEKDILIPLLHLIHDSGGSIKPSDAYDRLGFYFGLTEEERRVMLPSSISRKFDNRVAWARNNLCSQDFLDRSIRGVWKITEHGRGELYRLGLIDKPFPRTASSHGRSMLTSTIGARDTKSGDRKLLELALDEIAPNGSKSFPNDFIEKDTLIDSYEVNLPGTHLRLAPLSQTIITSPRGYFRYQAKNPPEAKYILYAYNTGTKSVQMPRDNLALFKVVKAYERYCDEIVNGAFEFLLDLTHDEGKAEELATEVARRLELRASLSHAQE